MLFSETSRRLQSDMMQFSRANLMSSVGVDAASVALKMTQFIIHIHWALHIWAEVVKIVLYGVTIRIKSN